LVETFKRVWQMQGAIERKREVSHVG